MLRKTFLILAVLCAAILIGCSKTETTDNSNTAAGNSNRTASTGPAGDKIGIPECDDFIAKYDACISDKVPEAARAQFKTAVQQWRSSWRQAAATPQGKAGLTAACKQAAEQARTSMKAYNCTF